MYFISYDIWAWVALRVHGSVFLGFNGVGTYNLAKIVFSVYMLCDVDKKNVIPLLIVKLPGHEQAIYCV